MSRVTPRLLAKIAAVGFVLGGTIAIVQYVRDPDCEAPAEVPWAPPRLDEIGASLQRAGKDDAWPSTRTAIETFAARWGAAYVAACELPEGRAREHEYACLANAYSGGAAILDALRVLDPDAITNAEESIAALDPCDQ